MSSAVCFNLDQAKILLSGNELRWLTTRLHVSQYKNEKKQLFISFVFVTASKLIYLQSINLEKRKTFHGQMQIMNRLYSLISNLNSPTISYRNSHCT